MSHTPLISIIMPVFNRPQKMAVALESIFKQTYKNYEIILVDDGSVPQLELSPKLKNKKNISVIYHDFNKGAAAARNTGMRKAKGDYIAFLDSDDEWMPQKLEIQIQHLKNVGPHISGCVTALLLKGSREQLTRYTPITNFRKQTLRGEHLSIGSTLLFQTNTLKKAGFQPEDLTRFEDWEWQISVSESHEWSSISTPLAQVNRGTPPAFSAVRYSLNIIKKRIKLKNNTEREIFQNRCLYELFLGAFLDKKWGCACLLFTQLIMRNPKIVFTKIKLIFYRRFCRTHLPSE